MHQKGLPRPQTGFAHLLIPIVILLVLVIGAVLYFGLGKSPQDKIPSALENKNFVSHDSPGGSEKSEAGHPQMAQSSKFQVVEEPKLIFTGGYADPTLSTLPDGKHIMYLNNFSREPASYEAHTSGDGVTWAKVSATLPNASTGRAVKFGSQTRLYYPDRTPIKPEDPPASILSAISTGGLIFKNEAGTRVDPRAGYYLEGPTVFPLPDGTYKMLFSENETASAEKRVSEIWGANSADGFTWTRDPQPTLDENNADPWPQALHPFVLQKKDGTYLMFYNTHSEVYAAESGDGLTWTKLGRVGIHGADVDGYYQADGSLRLFYGDFSEATLGVVYTTVIKEN